MNTYSLVDNDFLTYHGTLEKERRYVLKIKDLPMLEKPRERLLEHGPKALSVAELIAVLLSTGTKKEGVLEMSRRVLTEYGERSLVMQSDAKAMAKDLGIPLIKALQIVACGELGRRFYETKRGGLRTLRTAKDVYEYTHDMRELPKEQLRGLYVNAHQKVIHDEVISLGTVDSNLVHPREVFKPGIAYGASGIILVHNHPSGIVRPSAADIEITKKLIEAGAIIGISVLDHVIVAPGKFASVEADYHL